MASLELEHAYGPQVHLLDDPFLLSLLAQLGHPETTTSQLRPLLRRIYERLVGAALAWEFPRIEAKIPTRMLQYTEKGYYEGPILDPETKVVIACLVRAGVLPSEICYETLSQVLPSENLRLDYLSMSRKVDENGRVIGTDDSGLKIGGPIEDAILLLPDPMGATGGTVCRTLDIYYGMDLGTPKEVIALPMISTPEFLRRLQADHPEVVTYTARLDRGLSSPEALAAVPGTFEDERGLNDHQYIVPGAGGLGEILTNSWI
ncbi:MAG TPA: uracil phosphoribosyltransferase [Planctomycetes bacterium]|nr:uracil phosphoribosyltransferase [Planctomycetota bacterium]